MEVKKTVDKGVWCENAFLAKCKTKALLKSQVLRLCFEQKTFTDKMIPGVY